MTVCIAHAGDLSEPSGGTDRVSAIATGLADRGTEVLLVVPEGSRPQSNRFSEVDIRTVDWEILGTSNRGIQAIELAREARWIADAEGATLQFEHSILAGIGAIGSDGEYVLDMHDLAYPRFEQVDNTLKSLYKGPVKRLERLAVKRSRHVVVVSQFMADVLVDHWGVSRSDVTVVPNGYFPERIGNLHGRQPIEGRVAFLGTLHPKVDVGVLSEIATLDDVSELYVIGDGAQRESLETLARRVPELSVTGRLPDKEAFELVASSAVVVNPQRRSKQQRSSSPVKIYYYAALGKPMVLTEGPSVAADLAEAGAALVASDRADFVRQVKRVLSEEALANDLKTRASQVAESFTWEQRVEQISGVYEDLQRTGE